MGSGGAEGGGELGGAGSETCDGEVGRVGIGWYGHADGGGDDGGVGAGDEDGRVSRGGVGDGLGTPRGEVSARELGPGDLLPP